MLIDACYVTNTGKVRRINEDCLLLNETLVAGNMNGIDSARSEGDRLVYMVADGMGGHAKGDLASKTALTVFRERYGDLDTAEHIRYALGLAKENLDGLVGKDRTVFGLGTTVAGMFFTQAKAFFLNCGDSRVYGSDDSFRKMTKDHSLVQELVDSGEITEEEMRTNPRKNIITSALMGDLRPGLPRHSLEENTVTKGEKFLLCTDGLWESLRDSEMAECLRRKEIREGADCLFRKALDTSASDNLSFILLEVADI